MEEYYYKRHHVPAFGSWDWNDNLPFTQCFESARQAGLLRYSYSESEDRDLYVTGDLYENDVVTPAMIVVPRRRTHFIVGPTIVNDTHDSCHRKRYVASMKKEAKKQNWVSNVKELSSPTNPIPRPKPKPVDEDLYKISPELLYAKTRKRKLFVDQLISKNGTSTLMMYGAAFIPVTIFAIIQFPIYVM
ncbi:uncharacterized protein HKW66_Vig0203920 [Vigna angularis]|uniref:RIN4 pathogenic type III effector avirulence factor Avr cleavage site domain-containing protein n=1 Tax=Phaseolus angularis TaxID=3914 RepID=A0A8T0JVX5_PHAAN|nr:uncharacterized protein HKW66_Vig0203920 [Vigna angularis]